MTRHHVALATCSELPDGDPDDGALVDAFERLGISTTWIVWDDASVVLDAFDAILVRSTWDYQLRRDAFLAWCRGASRLLNSAETVAWSTDKAYLLELGEAGIGVVPTHAVKPGQLADLAPAGEFVVKPSVSAGSRDTARFRTDELDAADALVREIAGSGRQAILQPYLASVDARGETALVFIDGTYSHAIRKGPLLKGGAGPTDDLYAAEHITPRDATAAELAVGERCISFVSARFGVPAYARVDLIEDASGAPVVLELELAEPSLFFAHAPGAADALTRAIASRLSD